MVDIDKIDHELYRIIYKEITINKVVTIYTL